MVELADGSAALATVLRDAYLGNADLTDITALGDWRAYLGERGDHRSAASTPRS